MGIVNFLREWESGFHESTIDLGQLLISGFQEIYEKLFRSKNLISRL
jgi:hypothetical protein